jgi:hypothetical protein
MAIPHVVGRANGPRELNPLVSGNPRGSLRSPAGPKRSRAGQGRIASVTRTAKHGCLNLRAAQNEVCERGWGGERGVGRRQEPGLRPSLSADY